MRSLAVIAISLTVMMTAVSCAAEDATTMAEVALRNQIMSGIPPRASLEQVKTFLTQRGIPYHGAGGEHSPLVATILPSPQNYLVQGKVTLLFNFDANGQLTSSDVDEQKLYQGAPPLTTMSKGGQNDADASMPTAPGLQKSANSPIVNATSVTEQPPQPVQIDNAATTGTPITPAMAAPDGQTH